MKQKLITILLATCCSQLWAQKDSTIPKKQRLDFAKMYFEGGTTFTSSFTGKQLIDEQITSFKHSAAINPYLTWGAFHFWGYAEFYVTFPLKQFSLNKNEETDYELTHSVVTGARFYPWAMKEKKIRPYIGINWGASDLKQIIKHEDNQPTISKDFLLNYDLGIMYNYKNFALRMGVNYYSDNTWKYPVSKTQKAEIKTPPLAFQLGLLFTYESTKDNTKENIERWNSYPQLSKLSYGTKKFGDFFVGAGPSLSFSLTKSQYNIDEHPYLKEKLTSKNYFDIAIGYHFNKANLFTTLSFRNPKYKTEGYGTSQTIKKTSFTFEINKFLTDYTGFAPYIGINVAYDHLKFSENVNGIKRELNFTQKIEPGFTFGWDIVPGKTDEALILRTNLRWYPFSKFEIDGKLFNFSQLEYNLIQVVFYPQRLTKKIKTQKSGS